MALLIVAGVGAAAYGALFTSALGVREVQVTGLDLLDEEVVTREAGIADDHPILRVSTGAVEQRVADIAEVLDADVSRSWSLDIAIDVTERDPVAYFEAFDGIHLVDEHGVPFHTVDAQPEELPSLGLDSVSSDDAATRAALTVLVELPSDLRDSVETITADSPGSVEFTLTDGELVRWGDSDQMDRKATVLKALLPQPGDQYDVSSPELPTVS